MKHHHQTCKNNPRETLKCCFCYSHPDCLLKQALSPQGTIKEGLEEWQHCNDKYEVWVVGLLASLIIVGCLIILL